MWKSKTDATICRVADSENWLQLNLLAQKREELIGYVNAIVARKLRQEAILFYAEEPLRANAKGESVLSETFIAGNIICVAPVCILFGQA